MVTETKKDHREKEEEYVHLAYMAALSGQHSSPPRGGVVWLYTTQRRLQFLQWENRAQGRHAAFPTLQDTFQGTHLGLASQETVGESEGQTTRDS